MEEGTERGVFPGGVLLVSQASRIVHLSSHGVTSLRPAGGKVDEATLFDLASLTKILATTSLVLLLRKAGRMNLEDKVCRFVPQFRGKGRERINIRHLLEHSSGLPAWRAYHEEVAAASGGRHLKSLRARNAIRAMVAAETPVTCPGERVLYSDLGFILLDWILERMERMPLDLLFLKRIVRPLGLKQLFFIDLKDPVKAVKTRAGRIFAATESCPWRGRTLSGEVHDDNTYAMGGISGHAGLFGSAEDVARLAGSWLDSYHGHASLFDGGLVRRFWKRSQVPGSDRTLGFDTPSGPESQAGGQLGSGTVGHTGFTGTSCWLSPDKALVVVLLTNRVHPLRNNDAIRRFRPRLHDEVARIFG
jgi:serine-type D-Ala-D-Ala carboxypeptidase